MPVRSAADLIVLLLYAKGSSGNLNEEVKGITRIEKLMYLLMKEGGFEEVLAKELVMEREPPVMLKMPELVRVAAESWPVERS